MFLDVPSDVRYMDVFEISVNFSDSVHGGDRRKKSQQCTLDVCSIFSLLRVMPKTTFIGFERFCSNTPCMSGLAAMCGSTSGAFSRSKALLGSITEIERSRVGELQNPDPEHSLAPHWRDSSLNLRIRKSVPKVHDYMDHAISCPSNTVPKIENLQANPRRSNVE